MSKRLFILLVLCLGLLAPAHAGANHEINQLLEVARDTEAHLFGVIGNNAPVQIFGQLSVDPVLGTWAVHCAGSPFCALQAGGTLVPDTHVGPVDTSPCPVRRGTGSGELAPPGGIFGRPYAAAELNDLRLIVNGQGAVLEGAWRDDAGRGDRFAALLAVFPPVPGGCLTTAPSTRSYTGQGWALGLR